MPNKIDIKILVVPIVLVVLSLVVVNITSPKAISTPLSPPLDIIAPAPLLHGKEMSLSTVLLSLEKTAERIDRIEVRQKQIEEAIPQ